MQMETDRSHMLRRNEEPPYKRRRLRDNLLGINIEKEAELIKLKKSRLSASKRKLVMDRYSAEPDHPYEGEPK